MKELKKLHLVSHTHWDREWYLPFEVFRFRLTGLLDRLIDTMEHDSSYKFHLDGQAIILDDYLLIRPENKLRLRQLVQNGQLTIGPWYVLVDEFLVSGESLIRNLEEGKRICAEFGNSLKVGYLPDTFGHISQMPQILKQFGIEYALIWRGLNGTPEEVPSEFLWEASGGDRVIAVHLPFQSGYTHGANLPIDPHEAADRIRAIAKENGAHSLTGHVLLMNGFDHMEPQKGVQDIVDYWNRAEAVPMKHTGIMDYILEGIAGNAALKLPVLQGEFRHTNHMPGGCINAILPGVMSSRVYLKQQNSEIQTLLEKWVEPIQAIAVMAGGASHPEFIRLAWKYVLENHPHDSICGCSIDSVHDEMEIRFSKAKQIADQIVCESLNQLGERINTSWVSASAVPVLLFNSLAWSRDEIVEFEMDTDDNRLYRSARIRDEAGREWLGEIVSINQVCPIKPYTGKYPLTMQETNRYRIRNYISGLPALGYKVISVELCEHPPLAYLPTPPPQHFIENEFVRISAESDGSLSWNDLTGGSVWKGLHSYEDGGDIGDGYSYSAPVADERILLHTAPRVCILSSGYGWNVMKLVYSAHIPREMNPNHRERSGDLVEIRLTTFITLAPGSRTAGFRTEIHNHARDHRVRLLFSLKEKTDVIQAGAQFDVMSRNETIKQPDSTVWFENEPTTFPFHHFLYADTERGRLTLTAIGLHEYEWIAGSNRNDGILALTLFRSVSHLGGANRGMNSRMPLPAIATEGGQCLRRLILEYSLTIDSSNGKSPWKTADEQSTLIKSCVLSADADGCSLTRQTFPSEKSFIEVQSKFIHVSCIRPMGSGGKGIEVRLMNLGSALERTKVVVDCIADDVYTSLLNGTMVQAIPFERTDGYLMFEIVIGSKKFVTICIEFAY